MSGACEKCLRISDIDIPAMKCSCGHKTPSDTAKMLYNVMYESGKQLIKDHLIKMIGITIPDRYSIEVMMEQVSVDGCALVGDIRFDVSSCVKSEAILSVGQKLVKELIKGKKKELFAYFGIEVDTIAAAKIIAYLYDGETGRYAKTVMQNISELNLNYFYLGERVAEQNNSGLVYAPPATSVIEAFGHARLKEETYHGHILTVISEAFYPLGIIVRTHEIDCLRKEEEIEKARLFIFV